MPLDTIGSGKTYIEFYQGECALPAGSNRFGIRVGRGFCVAVVKNGGVQAKTIGEEYRIPVRFEMLPSHVRMIVDNHVLNYSASDLIDLMTGRKSFQQALESPPKTEPKETTGTTGFRTVLNMENHVNGSF